MLREWWRKADPARHGGPSLASVIEKVRGFSGFLGDEVVLAAVDERRGPPHRAPRAGRGAAARAAGVPRGRAGAPCAARTEAARPVTDRGRRGEQPGRSGARTASSCSFAGRRRWPVGRSAGRAGRFASTDRQAAPGLDGTPLRRAHRAGLRRRRGPPVRGRPRAHPRRMAATGPDERRDEALHGGPASTASATSSSSASRWRRRRGRRRVLAFDGRAARHPLLAGRARRPWARSTSSRPTPQVAAAFVVKSPALIFDDIVAMAPAGDDGRTAGARASWSPSSTCGCARTWRRRWGRVRLRPGRAAAPDAGLEAGRRGVRSGAAAGVAADAGHARRATRRSAHGRAAAAPRGRAGGRADVLRDPRRRLARRGALRLRGRLPGGRARRARW